MRTILSTAESGTERGMTTGLPDTAVHQTWPQVHATGRSMARGLQQHGVRRGDAVAVLAADPAQIAPAAQGVWLAGGSVTMLHQPTPRTDLAEWAEDTLRVLRMLGSRLVLLGSPFEDLADVLDEHGIAYHAPADLTGFGELTEPVDTDEDDTALLQLTSGSTAHPKAVRITHGNVVSNLNGMVGAAGLDIEHDLLVSWLPLFHDMGMVGCLTVPMAIGLELVKVTPADFLRSPLLWPRLLSEYRGTLTAAPNFAYAITGRRMEGLDDGEIDLSGLRFALNGAEPIDPDAVAAFTRGGARFGLRPECMVPAYGMAEATLAVSLAPLERGVELDRVDATALEVRGRAEPASGADTRAFPLLGGALPGLEVGVADQAGNALGEREVGELRVRGDAITPEYLTVDGPRDARGADGWLYTGDEGYVAGGEVVICGRRKDVIIVGGRNIYPTDIERAACSVDGVRAGNAVAVRLAEQGRRERFAVLVESREAGDTAAQQRISDQVVERVVDAVAARPVSVVVLSPGTLPKTPSGKLKRGAAVDLVP